MADLTLVTLALWEVLIGITRKKGFRGPINLGNWIKTSFSLVGHMAPLVRECAL